MLIPKRCECCGEDLINEGTRLYCNNWNCKATVISRINTWCKTQKIMNISEKTIESLWEHGVVKDIADLYILSVDEVAKYDGFSQGFQRVVDSIQNKKSVTLVKFLTGLDILDIGEKVIEKIINHFDITTFDEFEKLTLNDVKKVNGCGESTAIKIRKGLKDATKTITELLKQVTIENGQKVSSKENKLSGKSFCFTGKLETMKRPDAEKRVKELGGNIAGVSGSLDYLVTNTPNSGTSKNKKAREFGTRLITEQEFLKMLN